MKAFYFSALVMLSLSACKKESDTDVKQTAGKGGPAALRISMTYDGTAITNGRVRIKYNASAAPANPLLWSDSADLTALPSTASQALFPSLYKGLYYIEGTGYLPPSTFQQPRIVKGGFAYTLSEEKVLNLNITLDQVVQ